MTFMLRFAVLVLLCLSSAWAASLRGRPDVTCDLGDASSGLVVVSATAPAAESSGDPTHIWFHFNGVGDSSLTNEKIMITHKEFIMKVDSDFDGVFGRLYVLKLKAGNYEFRTWSFTPATPGERTTPVILPGKSPTALPFKVTAGRITYLGSFTPSMISDREMSVTVVDENQRDIPVFAKKCPKVDVSSIDLQLLKAGLWD